MTEALELVITGVVQGVGFRPFIYRLATKHGLSGYVQNVGGSAVIAVVEGAPSSVKSFRSSLEVEKPSAAYIESVKGRRIAPTKSALSARYSRMAAFCLSSV